MQTQERPVTASKPPPRWLDSFFHLTSLGTTVGTEIRAGWTTFFTMAYIIVLNPVILSSVPDANGEHLPFLGVAAMTCLSAAISSFLMGSYAKRPFACAAGLGINSMLAVQVATQMSWAAAMGVIVAEGVVVLVLVILGVRQAVLEAIPQSLRLAMGIGIGAFLLFIALVDSGFARRLPDAANTTVPVGLGVGGRPIGWPVVVFTVTVLVMLGMMALKRKYSIITGIIIGTLVAFAIEAAYDVGPMFGEEFNQSGWALTVPEWPKDIWSWPSFDLAGNVSVFGGIGAVGVLTWVIYIFTFLNTDFFDSLGTGTALGNQAKLTDQNGVLPESGKFLGADAVAAIAGGALSASSNTTYIESASGIEEGGRSGLTAVTVAVLFALALPFSSLAQIVPMEVGAAALVAVGIELIRGAIRQIEWDFFPAAAAAVVTVFGMPFTFSITNGIGFGVVTYTVLTMLHNFVSDDWRDRREISPAMAVITLVFLAYFCLEPIERALGVS